MHTIAMILGTRPEAIKMSPVIAALKQQRGVQCRVCVTGQHREMVDPILEAFGIVPDSALNIMTHDQTLAGLTARALTSVDEYLAIQRPDLVLVQGDTTTVFSATLASFYQHVPVGHVEAGLRTGTMSAPWPEEANRVLTARLASLHFAPTQRAMENLIAEGVRESSITVTGNTVVDALLLAVEQVRENATHVEQGLAPYRRLRDAVLGSQAPLVLITGHRRENFGPGLQSICDAIRQLAGDFPDVQFVYPVHLNPNVRRTVERVLGAGSQQTPPNVHLIEPLSYFPFVALMDRATLILTDSGGIQEEAPSLGKPVLVMRTSTERPEAISAGAGRVVGTETGAIVQHVARLLTDPAARREMTVDRNPFGDGHASHRIVRRCVEFLESVRTPASPEAFPISTR
jgi:UDP-N-acetylglucosamine 2-epimerase (non-hydrolysing)